MNHTHRILAGLAASFSVAATSALAAVTPQEAEQLKSTLTPMGAERAGNKEGTIPAWSGKTVEAKASEARLPPAIFADEKPLLAIKADNIDKYADKLAEGTKYLLKNYPGFRLDVYPTHRTATAPQYVYDNTYFNATNTRLDGETMTTAPHYKGGVPFPIPKTGLEAIFNTLWTWRGSDRQMTADTWFVSSSGKRSLSVSNILKESNPYYYTGGRKDAWGGKLRGTGLVELTAPAYSAGEKTLILGPTDPISQDTNGWTFLTGQRRLRKIPSVQYDVPFPYTSGVTNYDDAYGFNGATDRYDWKLVGKKEIYIPYNNNNFARVTDLEKVVGPQYVNPDHVRWELHRVWVVDATLKSGARHTVPKRRFYLDEDTWNVVISDQWDAKGQFWKNINLLTFVFPDEPVAMVVTNLIYNVQSKAYTVQNAINAAPGGVTFKQLPADSFTTQALERSGVR
ncbi:DUF1329 domain-containing protein [Massilia niastensis]|uniref:DUF1329 domain-containing protein n=1 Tax=Massilia niastensis TaxID=544911 RepID=UPI00036D0D98|nr:DUF1329 domain-containing protein [Massilia niastensis]